MRTATRVQLIEILKELFGKDVSEIISSFIEIPMIAIFKIPKNNHIIQMYLREKRTKYKYSLEMDWGDKTVNRYMPSSKITHKYLRKGIYAVHITGALINHSFSEELIDNCNTELLDITQWGDIKFYNIENLFSYCTNLKITAIDAPNLQYVNSLSYMFIGCTNLTGNFENWDVSNISDMDSMFYDCISFNGNLNNWNVSNVINMHSMFYNCIAFNSNLSKWNVRNVDDMMKMFYNCKIFNQDLSMWNFKAIDITCMFSGCEQFNSNIGTWDTSNVISMDFLFENCHSFNQDLGKWNVSKVSYMKHMFHKCTNFTGIGLDKWNVRNVSDMSYMFYKCALFANNNLDKWDVRNVSNMSNMFYKCTLFTDYRLDKWNVRK